MICLDAMKRSLRLLGVLEAGEDPSPDETSDAMAVLKSQIASLPGSTHWTDIDTAVSMTAGENQRIRVTTTGAVTISIPSTVSSAETLLWCCNQTTLICCGYADRAPKDGARVQISTVSGGATTEATYRYRADKGEWIRSDALVTTDELPINADLQDGFCAMLAIALCDEFGGQVKPATAAMAAMTSAKMRARYGKRQEVAHRGPRLSSERWRLSGFNG